MDPSGTRAGAFHQSCTWWLSLERCSLQIWCNNQLLALVWLPSLLKLFSRQTWQRLFEAGCILLSSHFCTDPFPLSTRSFAWFYHYLSLRSQRGFDYQIWLKLDLTSIWKWAGILSALGDSSCFLIPMRLVCQRLTPSSTQGSQKHRYFWEIKRDFWQLD